MMTDLSVEEKEITFLTEKRQGEEKDEAEAATTANVKRGVVVDHLLDTSTTFFETMREEALKKQGGINKIEEPNTTTDAINTVSIEKKSSFRKTVNPMNKKVVRMAEGIKPDLTKASPQLTDAKNSSPQVNFQGSESLAEASPKIVKEGRGPFVLTKGDMEVLATFKSTFVYYDKPEKFIPSFRCAAPCDQKAWRKVILRELGRATSDDDDD